MQRRLAARFVERAPKLLAVNGHDSLAGRGKARHEPLKGCPELLGIEHTEKPAERVMAWHAILELQKPAQKRLLGFREQTHVHRPLRAAKNRAHRHRQNLMEIMKPGVPVTRIFQTFPDLDKLFQANSPASRSIRDPVESISSKTQNAAAQATKTQMRFPWRLAKGGLRISR